MPFQLLNDAVTATNSSKILKDRVLKRDIFEPEEKVDTTIQNGDFEDHRSILLPLKDLFINRKIGFDITLPEIKTSFSLFGLQP